MFTEEMKLHLFNYLMRDDLTGGDHRRIVEPDIRAETIGPSMKSHEEEASECEWNQKQKQNGIKPNEFVQGYESRIIKQGTTPH
jgi:hypothetical protein